MERTSEQPKSADKKAETGETPPNQSSSTQASDPGVSIGPTEAEIENWAHQKRLRRQAWVDGPTEEEKLEWYRRERARRLARLEIDSEIESISGTSIGRDQYEDRRRLERGYLREARLATEGLAVTLATLPFRVMADLVATGREWERETLHPTRRRWIPFYDDEL